jgi:rhodanese-related sulfurtransferase
MNSITVKELHQLSTDGGIIHLIDVRSPGEYKAEHALPANNLPLDLISKKALEQSTLTRSNEPIYLICQSGGRSSKALQKLEAEGVQNLVNVTGGTSAWIAAQLPTVKGSGTISIERQVRIAAGFMVFIGVVLGHFYCPYFLLLSGFVGCGLIFAGISDWCGMGLLLAKMTWNR